MSALSGRIYDLPRLMEECGAAIKNEESLGDLLAHFLAANGLEERDAKNFQVGSPRP